MRDRAVPIQRYRVPARMLCAMRRLPAPRRNWFAVGINVVIVAIASIFLGGNSGGQNVLANTRSPYRLSARQKTNIIGWMAVAALVFLLVLLAINNWQLSEIFR